MPKRKTIEDYENDAANTEKARDRKHCADCHGDGFRTVEGPYDTSAAYPCDHKGGGPGNLGVHLPAAVEAQYRRDSLEAVDRKAKWDANPINPMNAPEKSRPVVAPLRRVTWGDIDRVKENLR